MKTILLLAPLMVCFIDCSENHPNTVEFIEIRHVGMEEKPVKSLIISSKEVHLKDLINASGRSGNSGIVKTGNPVASDLQFRYNFLVTDSFSYSAMLDFIESNQFYFTNNTNRNLGKYGDYRILVNGSTYDIFYKQKRRFFTNLIAYLGNQGYDKTLVKTLRAY